MREQAEGKLAPSEVQAQLRDEYRRRPDRYPYETCVASEQIFAAIQMLSEITGVPVQPNKAITGRNAFAHEAAN